MDPIREQIKDSVQSKLRKLRELANVTNASLYSGYRVVVYRMVTKDVPSITIPNVGTRTMDYLLDLDPSNADYETITEAISKDKEDKLFLSILDALYSKLGACLDNLDSADSVNQIKDLYRSGNLVEEIDITPLVSNVGINLNIEGVNSSTVTCFDASLASFKELEMQRVYAQNPWLQVAQNGGFKAYKTQLVRLKNFKFREYDLIRVYTYSSMNKSLSQRVEDIKSTLGVSNTDDLVSLLTQYAMKPAFTGFVQNIANSVGADSMASVSVSCLGVARILSQTSIVVDQALANQVVTRHRKSAGQATNNRPSQVVTQNIFSGKSSLEVFSMIMGGKPYGGNLYPQVVASAADDGSSSEPVVGLPSLKQLYEYTKDPASTEGLPNVIPLFPSLVALHYLKEKFSEVIFYCDDAVEPNQSVAQNTLPGFTIYQDNVDMLTALRPYMLMLKNNFELYDSTYMSPYDVLGVLRNNTYMEVFEDRTGAFHLRFPKYNNTQIDLPLNYLNVATINMQRSDSNNFSIVQTRFMADTLGAMRVVPPDVFLDGLSMIKFGFRMSAPVENPNSISATFSEYLGHFIKYYSTLKEGRTAQVSIVGDTRADLGKMVSFRYGYVSDVADHAKGYSNAGISANSSISSPKNYVGGYGDYVGYIVAIDETMGVDQVYQQNLTLKFVRDASIPDAEDVELAPLQAFGTPADSMSRMDNPILEYVLPVVSKLFVPGTIRQLRNMISTLEGPIVKSSSLSTNSVLKLSQNTTSDIAFKRDVPLFGFPVKDSSLAGFGPILSSFDLARNYLDNKKDIDEETTAGKAVAGGGNGPGGDVLKMTRKEILANISQKKKDIDFCYKRLAIQQHQAEFVFRLGVIIDREFAKIEGKSGVEANTLKGKMKEAIKRAFFETPPSRLVEVDVPPAHSSEYPPKTIKITKKNYYPATNQVMYLAQYAIEQKYGKGKIDFQTEFQLLSSEHIFFTNHAQTARWKNMWILFQEAMAWQYSNLHGPNDAYYKKRIVKDIDVIDYYQQGLKKPTGKG